VTARYKAWICGRTLTRFAGSNLAGDMDFLSLVSVVCCQVEASATVRSLSPDSPTLCAYVSEYVDEVRLRKQGRNYG